MVPSSMSGLPHLGQSGHSSGSDWVLFPEGFVDLLELFSVDLPLDAGFVGPCGVGHGSGGFGTCHSWEFRGSTSILLSPRISGSLTDLVLRVSVPRP